MKLKRKLFGVVALFCSLSLYSQPATQSEEIDDLLLFQNLAAELSNQPLNLKIEMPFLNLNLNDESLNLMNFNFNENLFPLESTDASILWDSLENSATSLLLQLETFSLSSKNLEEDLKKMKEDAEIWKIKSENFDRALRSNLEDQRVTNALAGELFTQVTDLTEERDNYKAQSKKSYIAENVLVTLPSVTLATVSIIELANGNVEAGLDYLKAAGITLVGFEVGFQCGHFLFNWW